MTTTNEEQHGWTVKSGVPFSMIRTTTSRPLNLAVIKSLSGGFENLYISAKGELITFSFTLYQET